MPTLNQRLQKFKLDFVPFPAKKLIETLGTFPLHNQIIGLTKLANSSLFLGINQSFVRKKPIVLMN